MTTADKIYRLRKGNGLTQEQLGEEIGVSRQTVQKWESGETLPTKENLRLLSEKFSVPLSVLYESAQPDEDRLQTEQKADNSAKLLKVGIFALMVAMVMLSINLNRISKELNQLSANYKTLRQKYESLENGINRLADQQPVQEQPYTYYDYKLTAYDYNTNMVTLQLFLTPADYTETTSAQFVVDTTHGSFSADGVLEGDMYTATLTCRLQQDAPVYLYLTDKGRVRSFLVDRLPGFHDELRISMGYNGIVGLENIKPQNGFVDFTGARLDITLGYIVSEAVPSATIYPKYMEAEIYSDEKLVAVLPFEDVEEMDFIEYAKQTEGYDPQDFNRIKYSTFINLGEKGVIADENITENSVLKIHVKVTDSYWQSFGATVGYVNK